MLKFNRKNLTKLLATVLCISMVLTLFSMVPAFADSDTYNGTPLYYHTWIKSGTSPIVCSSAESNKSIVSGLSLDVFKTRAATDDITPESGLSTLSQSIYENNSDGAANSVAFDRSTPFTNTDSLMFYVKNPANGETNLAVQLQTINDQLEQKWNALNSNAQYYLLQDGSTNWKQYNSASKNFPGWNGMQALHFPDGFSGWVRIPYASFYNSPYNIWRINFGYDRFSASEDAVIAGLMVVDSTANLSKLSVGFDTIDLYKDAGYFARSLNLGNFTDNDFYGFSSSNTKTALGKDGKKFTLTSNHADMDDTFINEDSYYNATFASAFGQTSGYLCRGGSNNWFDDNYQRVYTSNGDCFAPNTGYSVAHLAVNTASADNNIVNGVFTQPNDQTYYFNPTLKNDTNSGTQFELSWNNDSSFIFYLNNSGSLANKISIKAASDPWVDIVAGKEYYMLANNSCSWEKKTAVSEYSGSKGFIEVPAGFSGYVRIPCVSFGNYADAPVSGKTVKNLQVFVRHLGGDYGTLDIGNFGIVDSSVGDAQKDAMYIKSDYTNDEIVPLNVYNVQFATAFGQASGFNCRGGANNWINGDSTVLYTSNGDSFAPNTGYSVAHLGVNPASQDGNIVNGVFTQPNDQDYYFSMTFRNGTNTGNNVLLPWNNSSSFIFYLSNNGSVANKISIKAANKPWVDLMVDKEYYMLGSGSTSWTKKTAVSDYSGSKGFIEVPAGFSGYVRIPCVSFGNFANNPVDNSSTDTLQVFIRHLGGEYGTLDIGNFGIADSKVDYYYLTSNVKSEIDTFLNNNTYNADFVPFLGQGGTIAPRGGSNNWFVADWNTIWKFPTDSFVPNNRNVLHMEVNTDSANQTGGVFTAPQDQTYFAYLTFESASNSATLDGSYGLAWNDTSSLLFRVKNTGTLANQMSIITDGAIWVNLATGKDYYLLDTHSTSWTKGTTYAIDGVSGSYGYFTIPAGFDGWVRIPCKGFLNGNVTKSGEVKKLKLYPRHLGGDYGTLDVGEFATVDSTANAYALKSNLTNNKFINFLDGTEFTAPGKLPELEEISMYIEDGAILTDAAMDSLNASATVSNATALGDDEGIMFYAKADSLAEFRLALADNNKAKDEFNYYLLAKGEEWEEMEATYGEIALYEGFEGWVRIPAAAFSNTTVNKIKIGLLEGAANDLILSDFMVIDQTNASLKKILLDGNKKISLFIKKYDVNCDDGVDILDLVRLKKAIAATENIYFADVNGDGKIDSDDLAALVNKLLGINVVVSFNDVTSKVFTTLSGDKSNLLNNNPDRGFRGEVTLLVPTVSELSDNSYDYGTYNSVKNYINWVLGPEMETQGGENITVARMYFRMKNYHNTAIIPEDTVQWMKWNLQVMREKGIKVEFRAYYQEGTTDEVNGASKDVILSHIDTYASLWEEFKDIIYAVDFGLVGSYGEGANIKPVLDRYDWTNTSPEKTAIAQKVWDNLPESTYLIIRTPTLKNAFFANVTGLDETRIGYAQDAFFGYNHPNEDLGQGNFRPGTADWTTAVNAKGINDAEMFTSRWFYQDHENNVTTVEALSAIKAMTDLHLTTFNLDHGYADMLTQYQALTRDYGITVADTVMASWKNVAVTAANIAESGGRVTPTYFANSKGAALARNAFEYIRDYLGYHLSATTMSAVSNGENSIQVTLGIKNYGFSAAYNLKSYLAIVDSSNNVVSKVNVGEPNKWYSSDSAYTISDSLNLPTVSGGYKIAFILENDFGQRARLDNAINFENGCNILHTFTVD